MTQQVNEPVAIASPGEAVAQPANRQEIGVFPFVGVFLIALGVRIWFNFFTQHHDCADSCDASEYIRLANAYCNWHTYPQQFWHDAQAVLTGSASAPVAAGVQAAMRPFTDFWRAGPIFALFIATCFTVAGSHSLFAPLVVQCVLSAASCVLTGAIASYAWNRKVGLLAAYMAVFYPAFIVNSGRLYSECFATFLTCIVVVLTLRGFARGNGLLATFFLGVTASCLQLTRSVMVGVTMMLMPVTLLQQPRGRKLAGLAVLVAGILLIGLPWVGLQKLTYGKGGLTLDRLGHYNFFIGNNVDTAGWLTFPYADGTGIEEKGYGQLITEAYRKSPTRWFKLQLDKPLRLFKYPWNDFRAPIGPIGQAAQVAVHQALLSMMFIGVIFGITSGYQTGYFDRGRFRSRLFLLVMFFFYSCYFFFITVPRYNLTVMPVAISFAAAGLASVANILKRFRVRQSAWMLPLSCVALFVVARENLVGPLASLPLFSSIWQCLYVACAIKIVAYIVAAFALWYGTALADCHHKIAKASIIAVALLLFPLVCLPVRAHGRWYEWQYPMNERGQSISQTINLNGAALARLQKGQAYIAIDNEWAQALTSGARVLVNGQALSGPFIPGMAFMQEYAQLRHDEGDTTYWEGEYIFDCMAAAVDRSNADFRQWYLLPLPAGVTRSLANERRMTISIVKTDDSPLTLFGDYITSKKDADLPSLNLYSWEQPFYGVENDQGLADTRIDAKAQVSDETDTRHLAPHVGKLPGRFNIRLVVQPERFAGFSRDDRQVPLTVPDLQSSGRSNWTGTIAPPEAKPDEIWIARITGAVKTTGGTPSPFVQLRVVGERSGDGKHGTVAYVYRSPWTPRELKTTEHQSTFDVSVPLALAQFPGKVSSIETNFGLRGDKAKVIVNAPSSQGAVQFSNVRVSLVKLPGNPLSLGYAVY